MPRSTLRAVNVASASLLVAILVACGDNDSTTPATESVVDVSLVPVTSPPPTTVPADVPEVALPAATPTELLVTEVTAGTGREAVAGDTVLVYYVGVRSEDGTQFDTNFGGAPFAVQLGEGGVIAGWDQGLVGVQAGERLQLDIPADLAYADQPQGDVIRAGDALSFVIDVFAVADPAAAPTAEDIPTTDVKVDEVTTADITTGDGATLEEGMTGAFHLVAARADDGTVLQSTWDARQPIVSVIAPGQQLQPELIEGLLGMRVGGRRAITLPFRDEMGLTPETDVVIIADLLGAS